VAAVKYTFTHHHYTEYRERNSHNNKKKKIGRSGPCPVFASYTLALALQLSKKHGKTSITVVERCPDIPVAVVRMQLEQTAGCNVFRVLRCGRYCTYRTSGY
jgi:hypothetical protein